MVILPALMVSRVACSSCSQNLASWWLSSSFALKASPLVQAKIDATGLVDVGLPFWYCLQWRVTVPENGEKWASAAMNGCLLWRYRQQETGGQAEERYHVQPQIRLCCHQGREGHWS